MKRRLLWLPIALVVVLLGTGGSIWGHQVIAGNMAHSAYSNALGAAAQEIQRAGRDGMFPSELRPFSHQLSAVTDETAPTDKTFWSSNRESFYNRQADRLKAINRSLREKLAELTSAARHDAQTDVRALGDDVHRAHSDGLVAASYAQEYESSRLNLEASSRLGQYRTLAGKVQPKRQAFEGLIRSREKDLRSLMRPVLRSRHRLMTARTEIASRVSVANHDLNLLSLFHSSKRLRVWLNKVGGWAQSRSHVRTALIGAADLGTVNAAIRGAMNRYVPAKWILVSTENETITWFQRGNQVGTSLCTTGNPSLPTVKGHFTIFAKFSPFTFVSPEPQSSPDYYPPSPVSFAMEFQAAGYFIHDAPWRSAFGPGTDGPGQPGTNFGGTHGCVNVPYDVAAFLFGWAPMGTPVVVV